jgi:hypothetical protein
MTVNILRRIGMILYTYRCRACGLSHDVYRHVNDRDMPFPCLCGSWDSKRILDFIGLIGLPNPSIPNVVRQPDAVIDSVIAQGCGGNGIAVYGGSARISRSQSLNNGGAGAFVGPNSRISSRNSRYSANRAGDVVNEGRFQSRNDDIG